MLFFLFQCSLSDDSENSLHFGKDFLRDFAWIGAQRRFVNKDIHNVEQLTLARIES